MVITMAVDGRIPVRHEDVFSAPVLVMSVDPAEDFERAKAARDNGQLDPVSKRPTVDVQERDRNTGIRLWVVSIIDPTAKVGGREIKVKIAVEQQPVPPQGPMAPVEFEGLEVIPYIDTNKVRPRLAYAYRATAFRQNQRKAANSAA